MRTIATRLLYIILTASITGWSLASPPAFAEESKDQRTLEKTRSVQSCFKKTLLLIKDPENKHPDQALFKSQEELTSYQQITIFEHIRQYYSIFSNDDMDADWYCHKLVLDYLKVYREAWTRQQQIEQASPPKKDKPLAKPGSQTIESGSWFIDTFHNHWGKHDLGHSDITVVALMGSLDSTSFFKTSELGWAWDTCDCRPDKSSVTLLARATQAPDFYRWTDYRFHAHSPKSERNTPSARTKASADGLGDFLAIERDFVVRFRSAVREHDYDKAAFLLGSACHLVQDLVYHHGISLSEHAGLSYFATEDPDSPQGSDTLKQDLESPQSMERPTEALKHFHKAVRYTRQLIHAALRGLTKDNIQKLFGPHPNIDSEIAYRDLALRSLGVVTEDISTIELMKYLLLMYTHPSDYLRAFTEQNTPWDTEAAMQQLLTILNEN